MKLTNEDFESYEKQQQMNMKQALMNLWACETILKALDSKIKRKKKK